MHMRLIFTASLGSNDIVSFFCCWWCRECNLFRLLRDSHVTAVFDLGMVEHLKRPLSFLFYVGI